MEAIKGFSKGVDDYIQSVLGRANKGRKVKNVEKYKNIKAIEAEIFKIWSDQEKLDEMKKEARVSIKKEIKKSGERDMSTYLEHIDKMRCIEDSSLIFKKTDRDFTVLFFSLSTKDRLQLALDKLGVDEYDEETDYIVDVATNFGEFLNAYLEYLYITGELNEEDKSYFSKQESPVAADNVKITAKEANDEKLKKPSLKDRKAFEADIGELVKSFNSAVDQERVGYRQQYEAFFMAYVLLNNIAAPCPGCKFAMYHLLGALRDLFSLLIDENGRFVPVIFPEAVLGVFSSILPHLYSNNSYKKSGYVFSVNSPDDYGYIPVHNIPVSILIDAVETATDYVQQFIETGNAEQKMKEAEQRSREAEELAQIAANNAKEAGSEDEEKAAAARKAQEEAEKMRKNAEDQQQKVIQQELAMRKNMEKLSNANAQLNGQKLKKIPSNGKEGNSLTDYDIVFARRLFENASYGGRIKPYFDECANRLRGLGAGAGFPLFEEAVLGSFGDTISHPIVNAAVCGTLSASGTGYSKYFNKNRSIFVSKIQALVKSTATTGKGETSASEKTFAGFGVDLLSLKHQNVDFSRSLEGDSMKIEELAKDSLGQVKGYPSLSAMKQTRIIVLFVNKGQPLHKWILSSMCDDLADLLNEHGITGQENIYRVNCFEEAVAEYISEQYNKNVKKKK